MPTETHDHTHCLAEAASLKKALAAVQDAYTQASIELMAMQRVGRVEGDEAKGGERSVKGLTRR